MTLDRGHGRQQGLKVGLSDWCVPRLRENGEQEFGPSVRWAARIMFFEALEQIAPDAVSAIQDELVPLFRRLQDLIERFGQDAALEVHTFDATEALLWWSDLGGEDPWSQNSWHDHPDPLLREFSELRSELRHRLVAWSKQHGLGYAWVYEIAGVSLWSWVQEPGQRGKPWGIPQFASDDALADFSRWTLKDVVDLTPDEYSRQKSVYLELRKPFAPWELRLETEAQVRERFEAYLKQCKDLAERLGWQRVPVKRNRNGRPQLHFEWLVRFQVQGWTYSQITEHSGLVSGTESWNRPGTVGEAIRAIAALVGITLRQPERGRPKKDDSLTVTEESTQ